MPGIEIETVGQAVSTAVVTVDLDGPTHPLSLLSLFFGCQKS